MNKIKWGIIGCGDVTEIKSGPAFNKVPNSSLVAVMRRDAAKAEDYAIRHNVPKWYSNANELINDPEVNAVYIATPPSSHFEYAIAAMKAGKPVYVEKPMCLNAEEAVIMSTFSKEKNVKLVVAHYRRGHAIFQKIKQLIDEKAIGEIRFATMEFLRKPLTIDKTNIWRVDPKISGGGLFHDLAPHQLDLMYYFFGETKQINGFGANQAGLYAADDIVTGNILFDSGVVFNGTWCFSVAEGLEKDHCEMIGSEGKLSFSIFEGNTITITKAGKETVLEFDLLQHVQQPMIEMVVNYFLDEANNPCSGDDGIVVMKMLDVFTGK
ncbi:Gfo/Idh/MocA family protein [Ferruginibacter sp. SUN002]|uniref:Gfo/Idh/MocA family protein n=1 Tax=Ferruginibacter sp. SUN002 TaxID=2937789 RepID=UPI003D35B570